MAEGRDADWAAACRPCWATGASRRAGSAAAEAGAAASADRAAPPQPRASRGATSPRTSWRSWPPRSARRACCSRSWCGPPRGAPGDTRSSPASGAGARPSGPACTRCRSLVRELGDRDGLEIAHRRERPARRPQPAGGGAGLPGADRPIRPHPGGAGRRSSARAAATSPTPCACSACPTPCASMLRDGRLTAGHARALLPARDPERLAAIVVDEGPERPPDRGPRPPRGGRPARQARALPRHRRPRAPAHRPHRPRGRPQEPRQGRRHDHPLARRGPARLPAGAAPIELSVDNFYC